METGCKAGTARAVAAGVQSPAAQILLMGRQFYADVLFVREGKRFRELVGGYL